jgi:HAD superfamily hydrolase (TIGR01509 family)
VRKKKTNSRTGAIIVAKIHGIILDIDGTLIDSNDVHAKAWEQAFRENGHNIPYEKIRPLIGMGGDKVLPTTIGVAKDSPEGKRISQRRAEIFKEQYLPSLKPFPGAKELLEQMRDQGLKLAVASSAQPDELKAMLSIIGAEDLIEEETSSKDVEKSKPDPDAVQATLERLGCPPSETLMFGDTPYDIESASRAGLKTIAFRCGGWKDPDLAGALAIYDDPADLLAHYNSSPLA